MANLQEKVYSVIIMENPAEKKKVYVVRTNYNRPKDEAWLDGDVVRNLALGSDRDDLWDGYIGDVGRFYELDGEELERKIQEQRPGKPIVPCIEIALDGIHFHSSIGSMHLTVQYGDDLNYQRFKQMVLLKDEDVVDGVRHLPEGTEYLDLIVVYENSDPRFNPLVEGLITDPSFEVTKLKIMRPL